MEENIRRCVRDELELNIVQRTRSLILSAAVSTARDLDHNLAGNMLSNRDLAIQRSERNRRMAQDLPALVDLEDPLQLPVTLGGLRKVSHQRYRVFQNLCGFWIGTDGEFEDCPGTDDKVLVKGKFDLVSNHKEENIRRELERIFSQKFPDITMYDFEFVKRDRNISTPVFKKGH